jgi:hypothetical protein
MKSYFNALHSAVDGSINMPDPDSSPASFIKWAEDICQLLASIYERDYDQVTGDLMDYVCPKDDEG